MPLRSLACTLLLAAAMPVSAQTFDSFSSRGDTRSLALVRTAGDWQVRLGDTFALYGGELEWGRYAARVSLGEAFPGGADAAMLDAARAVVAGVDRVFPIGFGIPAVLSLGVDYAQAGTPGDAGVRELALPLRFGNNATIDFGSIWWHPTIEFGTTLYHRTAGGVASSGVRPDGATGIELGYGDWSIRGRLRHNLKAPQRAELALRHMF
jgi:hypothetical protein